MQWYNSRPTRCFYTMILLIMSVVYWADGVIAQPNQPPKVRVKEVKREVIQEYIKVTGSLKAVLRAEVASQEQGKLLTINVREAATVEEGDVLARIDDRRLAVQLKETEADKRRIEADLEVRKAEFENAEWNLNRLKPLLKDGLTTEKNIKDAETQVEVARFQLRSSERALERIKNSIDLLKVRLEDTVIRAPFDGRVVERLVDPGEWIQPGNPIVTLISTGTIEAWLDVPERYSSDVSEGTQPIEIELVKRDLTLKSIKIKKIPQIDPRARTFPLVAEIEEGDYFLAPGMSVIAWLPLGTLKEHLTLSKNAVMKNEIGFYVYAAQPNQDQDYMAVPTPIQVLFQTEDKMVVDEEGINEGTLVVVEGNERLRPMSPISLIQGQ